MKTDPLLSAVHFADATPQQVPEAVDAAVSAFQVHGEHQNHAKWSHRFGSDPDFRYTTLRLGWLDRRVVATVRLYHRPLLVGPPARRVEVSMAHVGDVGIVSDLAGRGLGHGLMQDTVRTMRERGATVANLGGRFSFYRQFGFFPFLEGVVQVDRALCERLAQPTEHTHVTTMGRLLEDDQWASLRADHLGDVYTQPIRTTDRHRWLLYDRNVAFKEKPVTAHFENGRLLGVATGSGTPGAPISVNEICWVPGRDDIAEALLASLARRHPQCPSLRIGPPWRPSLASLLRRHGVPIEEVESASISMFSIIDLFALVRTLLPVWQIALQGHEGPIRPITFVAPAGRSLVVMPDIGECYDGDSRPHGPQALMLNLSHEELIRLFFGLTPAARLNLGFRLGLDDDAVRQLSAMFPADNGFFGG